MSEEDEEQAVDGGAADDAAPTGVDGASDGARGGDAIDDESFARGPFELGALDADEARAALAEALAEEAAALERESDREGERDAAAGDESTDDGAFVDADPAALDATSQLAADIDREAAAIAQSEVVRRHLRGLLESLLFIADRAMKTADLAEIARADPKEARLVLEALAVEYQRDGRGFQLQELAGGWQLRTSATFAPFVRELTQQKPVRLSRAQVETLAIIAYRQPITRPEIEDIRGVDAGAVLKLLLERDLVRILGKKDEPGRPLLYGTTGYFLTFFGLKALRDLPTLREFTELTDESRDVVERELGEVLPDGAHEPATKLGDANVAAADVDPTAVDPIAPAEIAADLDVAPTPPDGDRQDVDAHPARPDGDRQDVDAHPARPESRKYDPSDEELYPDDDEEDEDDGEDDEDEGDDEDDEEESDE